VKCPAKWGYLMTLACRDFQWEIDLDLLLGLQWEIDLAGLKS
jgi:hypothetical protein